MILDALALDKGTLNSVRDICIFVLQVHRLSKYFGSRS